MTTIIPYGEQELSLTKKESRDLEQSLKAIQVRERQAEAAIDAIFNAGDHAVARSAVSLMMAKGVLSHVPDAEQFIAPIYRAANAGAGAVVLKLASELA